jgi:IrrE N-terminal-like domain
VSPEQAAAALLDRCGLLELERPPVDVDAIAEEVVGLDVQEAADLRVLPGIPDELRAVELSGLLLPNELRIWVNGVEAARSPGRRHFTIAHELGHWHLHRASKAHARGVFCRSGDVGGGDAELRSARRVEAEANRFAAALLMPDELVRREAERWKLNVHVLARRFEVSLPAMQLRLVTLGVLPPYMR